MDILTHTFSGFACGTVVASLHQGTLFDKVGIVLAGSIGGCLPDLDAISLWSGFDQYIGLSLIHIYCRKIEVNIPVNRIFNWTCKYFTARHI